MELFSEATPFLYSRRRNGILNSNVDSAKLYTFAIDSAKDFV